MFRPGCHPPRGVDWATDDHAVAVVDAEGEPIERFPVGHDAAGLRTLVRRLLAADVGAVGIERPDGPVVDALRQAGLTVLVIPPGQLNNLRSGSGSAGNQDDRLDASVLADVVRTDHRRLRPLLVDTAATTALRQATRARKDLVAHRVAVANHLRAHPRVGFPGAVELVAELDRQLSPRFLARGSTQARADWRWPNRMAAWLSSVGYCGRIDPTVPPTRLTGAPTGATGQAGEHAATVTLAFVAVLRTRTGQIQALAARTAEQLHRHPDAASLTSPPRAGTLRAARPLAEIGDARGRFPTPASLACLAGVAPATRQSGTTRPVTFRWGADNQLRDAVCDVAGDPSTRSRRANPWADQRYHQARARDHDHPHAVRILTRARRYLIWHRWQTNTPYHPANHGALQRLLKQDQQAAA